jgi:hypothetical protein
MASCVVPLAGTPAISSAAIDHRQRQKDYLIMKSNCFISLIPVAAGVLFGLATGACTLERTVLDGATLEREIARRFAERDLAVTAACPRARPPKAGDAFTCEARFEDGTALTIDVVQKDDRGNATWRFDGLLLDTRKDLVEIKAMLPTSAVITCAKRVLHLKQVGDTVSCDLRDGDHRARLVLSYKGDSNPTGKLTMKVVPSES